MKMLLITLVSVLALAVTTWFILNRPPLVPANPKHVSSGSNEVKRLEERISKLEIAVEKLQRETSPRFIPLSQK